MKRRTTPTTTEVLNALKSSESAMSHEMIQEQLTTEIDRATIYRILNRFCEDGLVHKIVGDDSKQYFAMCSTCEDHKHTHNHFHFRCLTCGTVECLDSEISVSLPDGYHFKDFNGVITGTCKTCK